MNEKLFIPGKSKVEKWSKKTAVIAYRHGMFTADEITSRYDMSLNELRKLNRIYYLEVTKQNVCIMPTKEKKTDKERIAELEAQLKETEKRLDDAELEKAVWSKMVDIAEKELGINIKKNSGMARRSISSGKDP